MQKPFTHSRTLLQRGNTAILTERAAGSWSASKPAALSCFRLACRLVQSFTILSPVALQAI